MKNYDLKTLYKNIERLRKSNNISQTQLGIKLGSAAIQPKISNIETGKDNANYTLEQVCTIAEEFNVPIDELFGIKHAPSPRSVASMLVSIIESSRIKACTIEREETFLTKEKRKLVAKDEKNTYKSLYFSKYSFSPEYKDFIADSDSTKISEFLDSFLSVYELYQKGSLQKPGYDNLVYQLLQQLPDKSDQFSFLFEKKESD